MGATCAIVQKNKSENLLGVCSSTSPFDPHYYHAVDRALNLNQTKPKPKYRRRIFISFIWQLWVETCARIRIGKRIIRFEIKWKWRKADIKNSGKFIWIWFSLPLWRSVPLNVGSVYLFFCLFVCRVFFKENFEVGKVNF